MQHIKRRTYTNFGNGDKDISEFEGDPTDSDPGYEVREGIKKNRLFLGKSPKLWVGGGQES